MDVVSKLARDPRSFPEFDVSRCIAIIFDRSRGPDGDVYVGRLEKKSETTISGKGLDFTLTFSVICTVTLQNSCVDRIETSSWVAHIGYGVKREPHVMVMEGFCFSEPLCINVSDVSRMVVLKSKQEILLIGKTDELHRFIDELIRYGVSKMKFRFEEVA